MMMFKFIIFVFFAFFTLACGSNNPAERTPTQTLKAISAAGKNKDAAGIKKLLSKGSLELIEKTAKSQNTDSDTLLTREGGAPFQNIEEYSNEKIENETATVEVKTIFTDEREKIPLVRENGEWKVALDVYVEDLKKRLTEQMKENPTHSHENQKNTAPNMNQNSAVNENLKSIQNRLRNNSNK